MPRHSPGSETRSGHTISPSQYQQRPETPEGGLFKRKWFKLVNEPPRFASNGYWMVSIDSALSTSETADYSAISVVYGDRDGYCVLFAERGRWGYEALKAKALSYKERIRGELYFIVEAACSGISLIHALRAARLRCFHYYPKNAKMSRAAYALPIIESGRVHILDVEGQNEWVEPYINEFVTFPYARFDDQVDSLTQLLPWAERRLNPGGSYLQVGERATPSW
jgi:predicted phage terminase large subunit-like protein